MKSLSYTPKARKFSKKLLRYVLVIVITTIVMLPFLWTIFSSFKTDSEIVNTPFSLPAKFSFENYIRAFSTLEMPLLYKNTFIIALVAMFFGLAITFISSFALSMMVFKSKKLKNSLYYFLISGLAIPVFILLFPVYKINIMLGLVNTYASLILPYIAISIPFNTLLFTGFLKDFPREIVEAAIIDGCGLFSLWRSIIIPIIKPVITTIFIFNILYVWNEFPFAVTLINKKAMTTISLGVSLFKGRWNIDYSGIIAASVLIIIPQLILFAFLQKYIIEGMTAGAVKG